MPLVVSVTCVLQMELVEVARRHWVLISDQMCFISGFRFCYGVALQKRRNSKIPFFVTILKIVTFDLKDHKL